MHIYIYMDIMDQFQALTVRAYPRDVCLSTHHGGEKQPIANIIIIIIIIIILAIKCYRRPGQTKFHSTWEEAGTVSDPLLGGLYGG